MCRYSVWTAHYLKQRPCCGNACRHCPWGHANVVKTEDCAPAAQFDVQQHGFLGGFMSVLDLYLIASLVLLSLCASCCAGRGGDILRYLGYRKRER